MSSLYSAFPHKFSWWTSFNDRFLHLLPIGKLGLCAPWLVYFLLVRYSSEGCPNVLFLDLCLYLLSTALGTTGHKGPTLRMRWLLLVRCVSSSSRGFPLCLTRCWILFNNIIICIRLIHV